MIKAIARISESLLAVTHDALGWFYSNNRHTPSLVRFTVFIPRNEPR